MTAAGNEVPALMERTLAVARLAANAFITMIAENVIDARSRVHGAARLRAMGPSLRSGLETGGPVWIVGSLTTVAESLAVAGYTESAATLMGAAESVRRGGHLLVRWRTADTTPTPNAQLAADTHPGSVSRGRAMSIDEAAAFMVEEVERAAAALPSE